MEKSFSEVLIGALKHFGYSIFYVLILLPFELWEKALVRLDEQRSNGSLKIANITGFYPFLSYLKRWVIDFLFDALTFISYFVGVIVAIVMIFSSGFTAFLGALVVTYFVPCVLTLSKDLTYISILPFRKFLNWVNKPAQHLDLEIKNKN